MSKALKRALECPNCGAIMIIVRFNELQQNPAELKDIVLGNKDGDLLLYEKAFLFCEVCGYPEKERRVGI